MPSTHKTAETGFKSSTPADRWIKAKAGESPSPASTSTPARIILLVGILVLGVYGGYFGAAQGILILGLMSVMTLESLQKITAVKNVLTTAVNGVAAITFMLVAWESIDWRVTAAIAVGAALGGLIGARVGRRLSPNVLRMTILAIGTIALVRILFFE